MNSPFLSIITINYNNAEGLRKTLESVKNQTSKDYEHIIIDGGSNDKSLDVIKDFLADKQYAENVAHWCSEKDNGIYDAMNKGIAYANGKYCLFLNSGDYLADNDVVNRFSSYNLTAPLIYTNIIFYNRTKEWKATYPSKITVDYFYQRKTLSHQNTLIQTSYMKANPYTTKYRIGGDVDFYWKALCINRIEFKYIDDVISKYEFEFGLSTISSDKERRQEWDEQIAEYVPKIYQEAFDNLMAYKNELNIYENCYHGLLKKIRKLCLMYTKLKYSFRKTRLDSMHE